MSSSESLNTLEGGGQGGRARNKTDGMPMRTKLLSEGNLNWQLEISRII